MRVINETNINYINDLETKLKNASSEEELRTEIDNILQQREELRNNTLRGNIESLGSDFLRRWLIAMRLDEFLKEDNTFIEVLGNSELNKQVTKDVDSFTKAYNAYASNLFDNEDRFQYELLSRNDIYKLSGEDFKDIFKIYNKVKSDNKDLDPDLLYSKCRDIFYNGNDLKSIAELENRSDSDIDQDKLTSAIKAYANEDGTIPAENLSKFIKFLQANDFEIRTK